MKILVNGGAGYIGASIAHRLIELEHDVIILDNLSVGSKKNIPQGATFYLGDITNYQDLKNVFSNHKIDVVIHLAGKTLVSESMENPHVYFENNVGGLNNTLKAMVDFKVNKLMFSSSGSIYGRKVTSPIKEDSPPNAESVYAETKVIGEKLIKWYGEIANIDYLIFRYFNAAGAYKDKIGMISNTHLIPIISKTLLGKFDYFKIAGDDYLTPDGTCVRDYIDIHDLVEAHIKGISYLNENNKSEIINIGTGRGYSVKEVVNQAIKMFNSDKKVIIAPRRSGDVDMQYASTDKSNKILKWHSKKELAEMIASDYNFRKVNDEN